MAYIDLRVEFALEDEGDFLYPRPVRVLYRGSDLPEATVEFVGEAAFQSDTYTVDVSNALLGALGGEDSSL